MQLLIFAPKDQIDYQQRFQRFTGSLCTLYKFSLSEIAKDSSDPLGQTGNVIKSYREQIFKEYSFQHRYRLAQLSGLISLVLFKWKPSMFLVSTGTLGYYFCPELFSVKWNSKSDGSDD